MKFKKLGFSDEAAAIRVGLLKLRNIANGKAEPGQFHATFAAVSRLRSNGLSWSAVAVRLNCTPTAARRAVDVNPADFRSYRSRWSQHEIDMLRRDYGSLGARGLEPVLGRSAKAIARQAFVLGLKTKRGRPNTGVQRPDLALVVELRSRGLSWREVAKELGTPVFYCRGTKEVDGKLVVTI